MQEPPAQIYCPQCGAPAQFRGTTVSLVCEYCNSTIVREGVDVRLIGQVSAIVDTGSPILLDARGRYNRVPFIVTGRLQVQYARGTWNEWYLELADGTQGWLADAQGSYSISTPRSFGTEFYEFDELDVGMEIPIMGITARVTDHRRASYLGAEGVLPFAAEPGMEFCAIDLRGPKGEFFTVDYGDGDPEHPPQLYSGQSVDLETLGLSPLRQFDGWPPPGRTQGRASSG